MLGQRRRASQPQLITTTQTMVKDSSRMGGRLTQSHLKFSRCHPIILHGKDRITHLILVTSLNLSTGHAGAPYPCPPLVGTTTSSEAKLVCSTCRKCICRLQSAKPSPVQLMRHLLSQRITPGPTFQKIGIDFAGPIYTHPGARHHQDLDSCVS